MRGAATCIQRMQKALTQMNVQLANVISDISGLTGQAIMRAIVAGERNPLKLAMLSDPRVHASHEEIAKSLEGNWRPELLFVLHQEVDMYDTYQKRIGVGTNLAPKHDAKGFGDVIVFFNDGSSKPSGLKVIGGAQDGLFEISVLSQSHSAVWSTINSRHVAALDSPKIETRRRHAY